MRKNQKTMEATRRQQVHRQLEYHNHHLFQCRHQRRPCGRVLHQFTVRRFAFEPNEHQMRENHFENRNHQHSVRGGIPVRVWPEWVSWGHPMRTLKTYGRRRFPEIVRNPLDVGASSPVFRTEVLRWP